MASQLQLLFVPPRRRGSRSNRKRSCAIQKGLFYEQKVGKYLQGEAKRLGVELWDHPWLPEGGEADAREAYSKTRPSPFAGWCSPDFVLWLPTPVILEVKLTWVDVTTQRRKYMKALRKYSPIFVQVCRNLRPDSKNIVGDLMDCRMDSVWHLWL